MMGLKFTRQKSIGNYIADFYCTKKLVVIEVDGSSHIGKEAYDEIRTQFLNWCGLKVIRIQNADVIYRLDAVKTYLHQELSLNPPYLPHQRQSTT